MRGVALSTQRTDGGFASCNENIRSACMDTRHRKRVLQFKTFDNPGFCFRLYQGNKTV
jgi:hypothetical protein